MINTSCRRHPNGQWGGSCICNDATIALGRLYTGIWESRQEDKIREIEKQEARRKELEEQSAREAQASEQAEAVTSAKSKCESLVWHEKSFYPGHNFINDISLFDLASRMLKDWDSEKAVNTRKILRRSCFDFIMDIEDLHIYHQKYGLNEYHVGTLKELQDKIENVAFWRKLYYLFYDVSITFWTEKGWNSYEHLFTTDKEKLRMWKSRDNWEYLSNWPSTFVKRFIFICISVTQHDEDCTDEMQEMFDRIHKEGTQNFFEIEKGFRSKIPKEYATEIKDLLESDFHDSHFWFLLYCLIRLELRNGMAHYNILGD